MLPKQPQLKDVLPYLHSRGNVIESNEIHHAMELLGDGNGIYIHGAGADNVIRRNYIHHLVALMKMQAAIRTDGGQTDTLIAENLIYKCTAQGIILKLNSRCENNIVADVIAPPRGYYLSLREGPLTGATIKRNVFYSSSSECTFIDELPSGKGRTTEDRRGRSWRQRNRLKSITTFTIATRILDWDCRCWRSSSGTGSTHIARHAIRYLLIPKAETFGCATILPLWRWALCLWKSQRWDWQKGTNMTTVEKPSTHFSSLVFIALAALLTNGLVAQEIDNRGKAQDRKGRAKYLVTDGERKLEVVYKTVSGRDLKLDLYYPTSRTEVGSQKPPVIVFTHGGGWAAGSRYKAASGSFAVVFSRLIEQGFAVAPVTYRLAKKDSNVAMRDCVIDCKDAVRYLAKNSESLGIDPMRFGVMGDSAGGHIAQMLLLSSPEQLSGAAELAKVPYRMVSGVSWYGPGDFEKMELFNHDDRTDFKDRFAARIMGAGSDPSTKLDRYREVSPVNYLSKDSPPLLMIQGDKDTTIPVKHAHYMQERARAVQAPVEILIIKNSGHNWRRVDADIDPSRETIIERTVQFFVDHL